ncbi:GntR family transcriptional regulator [Nocardiopsis sp. CNR-923]|uniref:GntR family transcriptional regulator n=1 Tax=Nocardiopsis sp. CNR-923 TaxID=1904965 RepID=UPI000967265D|nr:GntR family transcriptional regulator [Nocardiopsis sp. CNR-923]OLT28708.1 GntR family transcriptional regulator [Nocardiopsis sp. CNR-923]
MVDLPQLPDDPSKLAREPLREQIRQVLVEGLLSGRWKPGERIVERRVATELRVSQAPVREALRELETLRLIETVPNKGARVRAFGVQDMAEIYPVRAGLELVAARLAAPRLAADPSALEREVEALKRATAQGDVSEQIRHSVEFHREIVRAADNSVLLHTWESLGVEVWTALSVRWLDMQLHAKAGDHDQITRAFREGDPAVGQMVSDHVLNYVEAALRTHGRAVHR